MSIQTLKDRITPDQLQGLVAELQWRSNGPNPLIDALRAIARLDPALPAADKVMAYSRVMAEALRQLDAAPRVIVARKAAAQAIYPDGQTITESENALAAAK